MSDESNTFDISTLTCDEVCARLKALEAKLETHTALMHTKRTELRQTEEEVVTLRKKIVECETHINTMTKAPVEPADTLPDIDF